MIVDNGREVVIRVRGLAKSFGSHQIWDGLSLDVYRGEILAIVGGSGQGKSVLMRVITGLVKPDAGDVGLFGQSAKTLTPQDRLEIEKRWGILFQDGANGARLGEPLFDADFALAFDQKGPFQMRHL